MQTYTTTIQKPRLVIRYDDDAQSPREWDNLGYFITVDSRHHSPDRNEDMLSIVRDTGETASSCDDHMRLIKRECTARLGEKVVAIYPVTKYEHSAVTYSLGSKHGFDHSNNGFYIVTDKTQKVCGTDKKRFEECIKGELETYNQWINGEVFRFTLYDENGELEDSCSGFYDMEDIRAYLPDMYKKENLSDYLQQG